MNPRQTDEPPNLRSLQARISNLARGRGRPPGFTGTVSHLEPAQPDGVPAEHVMLPFDLRLAYQSRHWLTVPFELGHDEIDSTAHYEMRLAPDIVEIFEEIGLETPQPIPVLALDHQVAQKLHACTSVNPKTGDNLRRSG